MFQRYNAYALSSKIYGFLQNVEGHTAVAEVRIETETRRWVEIYRITAATPATIVSRHSRSIWHHVV